MVKVCYSFFFWLFGTFSVVAKDVINVAVIETLPVSIVIDSRKAFCDELVRAMPNFDIDFSVYNAHGSQAQAAEILQKLTAQPAPDLIVSVATLATRALFQSTDMLDVPKLFMAVSAPVEEGIVTALGETSARNITGESHVLDAKVKLDMLDGIIRASAPQKPLTIGLVHSTYPSAVNAVKQLLALDEQYENINLVSINTPYIKGDTGLTTMPDDIVKRLSHYADELDGYWLSSGPLVALDGLIEKVYEKYQLLPFFGESIKSVERGALLGVVAEPMSIGKSAAKKAKMILEKKSARNIPVDKLEDYTIAVNVSTAVKLQMPIPSSYLKLAKNHVYH